MPILKTQQFDHHSPEFTANWKEIYRQARVEGDVIRSSAHGGFTVLLRHGDVRRVLHEPEIFTSGRVRPQAGRDLLGGVAIPPNGMRIGFIEMDRLEHTSLRRKIIRWFSSSVIAAGQPRIQQISSWVLDQVIEQGECDVTELSRAVPALLVLDVLGMPLTTWKAYGQVLHSAVAQSQGSYEGLRWLRDDIRQVIGEHTYAPDGLLADMLRAGEDGDALPEDLICELVIMLLFGGSDTTIATMGHAMQHLSANPGHWEALRDSPSLMKPMIEEIFRFYSPALGQARTVSAPTEGGGVSLTPGERVLCALGSANFDKSVFDYPDIFMPNRSLNPHIAFGGGAHVCLGQHLARIDTACFLREFIKRMPDFKVDAAGVQPYHKASLVNVYNRLPMKFSLGRRASIAGEKALLLTAERLHPVAAG